MGLSLPIFLAVAAAVAAARAGEQSGREARPAGPSLPTGEAARTAEAVRRGLDALRREIERTEDGAVPKGDAKDYAPVGVTALATLAFLGEGNVEGRGASAPIVERTLGYLLAKADASGYVHTDGDGLSRMHGHGYATLAFAEAYGMFGKRPGSEVARRLGEALPAAVRLIEKSQGESGGWYYDPVASIEHEGSVTVCLVQALRAARNAGIAVKSGVIERALEYLRRLRRADGAFAYQIGSDQFSPALTAAGVATLQAMGEYEGEPVEAGIAFLLRSIEGRRLPRYAKESDAFPEYERFYTAQALYQYRDPRLFERWFRAERDDLLARQRPDGAWDKESRFGTAYTTATNCLVLEIPLGVLPIFQR